MRPSCAILGPDMPADEPSASLDVALVKTVTSRALTLGPQGRRAVVFDGLLRTEARVALHVDLLKREYTFTNNDSHLTEFARHLVHTTEPNQWADDPVITEFLVMARTLMRALELDSSRLERVYANLGLFGDHHHTHTDGDCWTVLFFANAHWNADWGGELLLYEDDAESMAVAVAPRPGRAVIFDGDLPHRAGVPSKYCPEARLTVAVKFLRL